MKDIRPFFWQNDTSISKNSWGYVADQDYKTAASLIGDLVDIVSKNGALLLNIGPRPDGTIPEPEQEILLEIGRWLAQNGEAIYGTRPWNVYGEGPTEVPEGSFTDTKRQALHQPGYPLYDAKAAQSTPRPWPGLKASCASTPSAAAQPSRRSALHAFRCWDILAS